MNVKQAKVMSAEYVSETATHYTHTSLVITIFSTCESLWQQYKTFFKNL